MWLLAVVGLLRKMRKVSRMSASLSLRLGEVEQDGETLPESGRGSCI